MNKAQAEKAVQEKLRQVSVLMQEAAALMDEHGFTASVHELDYIPNGLDYPESTEDDPYPEAPLGFYFEEGKSAYDDYFAGQWLPSSRWRGC